MPIQHLRYVWHNGRFIPWTDATLHVSSHAVCYGSAVFDGFRCYPREHGTVAFRVQDHMERLLHSAAIYDLPISFSLVELCDAVEQFIRINELQEAYIRPMAMRGYGESGIVPTNYPVEVYLLGWRMGAHLGAGSLEQGTDVCVASWSRMAPNTLPAMAKAAGNYLNSLLIRMEAIRNGYAEGIALNVDGTISEGSGENIFIVRKHRVYTTPLSSSILRGITRDTILTLAAHGGIEVIEEPLPRELLYCSDEIFLCGSAAEITPVRSVDRKLIGTERPGPITRKLQSEFFGIINGEMADTHGWLTYVESLSLKKEVAP